MNEEPTLKAVVQKIIEDGKHGPFAVASAEGVEGSITFSLAKEVWKELVWPMQGEYVVLSKIREKRAGWRAMEGRFFVPKQIASKEQTLYNIKAVLATYSKFFSVETEMVWNDWVNVRPRSRRSLLKLVFHSPEVHDAYKSRALFILLTPDFSLLDFPWNDSERSFGSGKNYLSLGLGVKNDGLESLSETLLAFMADLVIAGKRYMQGLPEGRDRDGAIQFYNALIIDLMGAVPLKAADLYPMLDLNDPQAYSGIDESSGYNPFSWLLGNPKIAEVWKRVADSSMQERIRRELAGQQKPRTEWEEALKNYSYIIQIRTLHIDELPYSEDLLARQISFLIEIGKQLVPRRELIASWTVAGLLEFFGEDKTRHESLMKSIAEFVLIEQARVFTVYSEETLRAAELMLELLGDKHPLHQRLLNTLQIGRQELAKKIKSTNSDQEKEAQVLVRMKK